MSEYDCAQHLPFHLTLTFESLSTSTDLFPVFSSPLFSSICFKSTTLSSEIFFPIFSIFSNKVERKMATSAEMTSYPAIPNAWKETTPTIMSWQLLKIYHNYVANNEINFISLSPRQEPEGCRIKLKYSFIVFISTTFRTILDWKHCPLGPSPLAVTVCISSG